MTESYKKQLATKEDHIREKFSEFLSNNIELRLFESPEEHFRQRAEFRIWHERDADGNSTGEMFYAMFEVDKENKTKKLKRTDQLPIACEKINELMPQLLKLLAEHSVLFEKLFQIEFLSTLQGETLVTLIYHKQLEDAWKQLAQSLEMQLGIYVIGRSRKQKVVVSQDYVTEQLHVNGHAFYYQQMEGGFTQPNAKVCEKMLSWACDAAQSYSQRKDLLELYCGNGNFTLPLSQHFQKVLATEVAKTSVKSARNNIVNNQCDNIAIARLSAEEFTEAFNGERQFKRLQQDSINLSDYDVSTIFVDPPRAGIDTNTLKLMQKFEQIIYISCNPDTLFDNLQLLKTSHKVTRLALFDQFPYTHHIEMGVCLIREG